MLVEATVDEVVLDVVPTALVGGVLVVDGELDVEQPATDPPTTRAHKTAAAARFNIIGSGSLWALRPTGLGGAIRPGLAPGTPQVWRVRRRIWRH